MEFLSVLSFAVFFLALFSQFVSPDAGWPEKAILTLTAGCIDAGWYALVAVSLSRSGMLEHKSPCQLPCAVRVLVAPGRVQVQINHQHLLRVTSGLVGRRATAELANLSGDVFVGLIHRPAFR